MYSGVEGRRKKTTHYTSHRLVLPCSDYCSMTWLRAITATAGKVKTQLGAISIKRTWTSTSRSADGRVSIGLNTEVRKCRLQPLLESLLKRRLQVRCYFPSLGTIQQMCHREIFMLLTVLRISLIIGENALPSSAHSQHAWTTLLATGFTLCFSNTRIISWL